MSQHSKLAKNVKVPQLNSVREITLEELNSISGGIATRPTWPPVVRPPAPTTSTSDNKQ